TICKDEIKPLSRFDLVGRRISDHKIAFKAVSCVGDIGRIMVYADVRDAAKKMCVCTWAAADVQNAPNAANVIVSKYRCKLRVHEGGLPQTVGVGQFHDSGKRLHFDCRSSVAAGLLEYGRNCGGISSACTDQTFRSLKYAIS